MYNSGVEHAEPLTQRYLDRALSAEQLSGWLNRNGMREHKLPLEALICWDDCKQPQQACLSISAAAASDSEAIVTA